ncbi:hypothetical protein K7I13_10310 [Brucepastera parasyntrophica]|uniref:hypothetical protein n=1 Tax=Brucepastera parasyntrophica TaxID=2880008 RepID=UPI00210EF815|nr:hypothetical protein [Brucepastera parasyntrophica]ULQ58915.1 hypothetical protein K7I13_10310 [Brucepastera parasyntrophica]
MDINQTRREIQQFSSSTEGIYVLLAEAFPSLLEITKQTDSSSLHALEEVFKNLSDGFLYYQQNESDFLKQNNVRTEELFSEINEKMAALDQLNESITSIRKDSEELEIISLNAMVISIKSGEKGRAFSRITETLKALSTKLISVSSELILKENRMIEKNTSLKTAFSSLLDMQKKINRTGSDAGQDIMPMITAASRFLDNMSNEAGQVSAPIRQAMTGIQLQDIIRQSFDQVILALAEIRTVSYNDLPEEQLDQIMLNMSILDVCLRILPDIITSLGSSARIFSENWEAIHKTLDSVEYMRKKFLVSFFNEKNPQSIPCLLKNMSENFSEHISQINEYQHAQKSMVNTSAMVVTDVKQLRSLFDTIHPIISRLQHIRIAQQIEVAKNAALSSVKDTVDHMSDLIANADILVQDTKKELGTFISNIEKLINAYTSEAQAAAHELVKIKREKTEFFNKMTEYDNTLGYIIQHLHIYPDSFMRLCNEIDVQIAAIQKLHETLTSMTDRFNKAQEDYSEQKNRLMEQMGVDSWAIRNDKLRDLSERFTITVHKQAVGKIGGFESKDTEQENIGAGEITLF